jgi:hypothetical protein
MKQTTLMVILTGIIIVIASFGKYVESNITTSATSILENRLKPVPALSRIFDYYGTTVQDAITTSNINIQNIQQHRDAILEEKIKRDTLWNQYTNTYLVDSESKMVDKVKIEMNELDNTIDFILTSPDTIKVKSIITSDRFNADMNTTMNDINWLLDLQTQVGQEETMKMIALLERFSHFMVGAIALAFIMLGSIIYPKIFNKEKLPIKPVRRTKTTPAKKSTTRKPVAKKPAAKPRKA